MGALKVLLLNHNQIGDAGLQALAGAIGNGSMVNLNELDLSINRISDEGVKVFASAIASGSLPAVQKVVVDSKHKRLPQLVAACQPRGITIG